MICGKKLVKAPLSTGFTGRYTVGGGETVNGVSLGVFRCSMHIIAHCTGLMKRKASQILRSLQHVYLLYSNVDMTLVKPRQGRCSIFLLVSCRHRERICMSLKRRIGISFAVRTNRLVIGGAIAQSKIRYKSGAMVFASPKQSAQTLPHVPNLGTRRISM